ncbi:type VI secretion system baseplate subunit TssG [Pseudorhodoferax sp.]|uniref:type VI secretion system baseplate subunit TssG n=1 Tax=Pseudorhodoferax sp. TaxID=1993553 RepID=UPI0039E54BF3
MSAAGPPQGAQHRSAQRGDTPANTQRDAAREALFASLRDAPWAHDFFALLRRLEALHPEAPRIGRALRPSQEPIRLGQEPELDFAPAPLASFAHEKHMPAPRLGVRFFGLLGPQGPMPLHLTEYVRERLRWRNDPTAARFLDMFHHRMLALFYRAWADAQPTVQHDRPGHDRFAAWLGAGFGQAAAAPLQGALPRQAQLFQAGLLGARSRHPEGLAKLLAQYFRVPVRIEEHVAHRLTIAPEDCSRLGHARNRPERVARPAAQLGRSANAGHAVPDRQFRFRVVLGPLTLAQYHDFLPAGRAWPPLRDWVRQYAGLDLRWDVQLVLARAELPAPRLGRQLALGVACWLGRRRAPRDQGDRGDLHLRPGSSFLRRHGGHHA